MEQNKDIIKDSLNNANLSNLSDSDIHFLNNANLTADSDKFNIYLNNANLTNSDLSECNEILQKKLLETAYKNEKHNKKLKLFNKFSSIFKKK